MKKIKNISLSLDETNQKSAIKSNYYKSQDLYKIPATQMFIEMTGEIPSSISFINGVSLSKVLSDKKIKLELITEKFNYSKNLKNNLTIISASFFKYNEGVYLHFYDGSTMEDELETLLSLKHNISKSIDLINESYCSVTILYKNGYKNEAFKVAEFLNKYVIEQVENDQTMFIVCEGQGGLYLEDFDIDKYPMDLELNYGKDFVTIHETILNKLNKKKDKGVVLLHGLPGTGKSHYLRHLVTTISKEKQVIYIPPDLTHQISSPHFIPFLMKNKNSILFIEDAENVLQKRQGGSNQAISNLLNLSDGLLSDCLSIQIVCTFNCNVSDIDPALLRKGRLIAKHEFNKLPIDNCQRLSDSLGFKNEIKSEMTLAEVFNQDENTFIKEKKSVGFK